MKAADKKRFGAVIAALTEEYDIEFTAERVRLWENVLSAYDIDDIERAAWAYLGDREKGKFKPHPADFAEIIDGSTETQAMRAWTALEQAVKYVGPWTSVVFDDPLIHAVVEEMGGWIAFCETGDAEWPFKRNEFVKRYRGFCRQEPESYPRVLIGTFEANNERTGGKVPPPTLVGNKQLALLVYRDGRKGPPIMITQGESVRALLASVPGLPAPATKQLKEQ
jgi:hypothetical protein